MKLTLPDLSQQPDWEGLMRFTDQGFHKIVDFSANGFSFSDNIDCKLITAVFVAANTELVIPHTLKRVPIGYLPYNLTAATIVYNGTTAFTNTNIYLKASVATTVSLIVF